MANVTLNEDHLKNIANAIRTKKGTVNKMTPRDMAGEISSIVVNSGTGGTNTNDATATASDIASGKTAYVKGVKVTGTIPNKGNWNGTISNLNGVTVPNGIHNGSGKVDISQTEKSKLIPSNIKNGVSILGVNGTYQGSGGGTSSGGIDTNDATAYSENILSGKTAYARGEKITGSMADNTGKSVIIRQKYGINKIPKGYYNGESTVDIDTESFNNITSENIKKGVTILGITGSYSPSNTGIDTSDATAISSDILTGKTAYANGSKITGTMKNNGVFNVDLAMTGISYTLKEGYYTGGLVQLASSEKQKLIPENIKSGITLFGVTGSYTGGSSGGGGSQIKTGTTTTTSIYTGLSSIDKFIIYADKINSMGMVNVIYDSSRSQVTATLCGSYNNYVQQCRTEIKTDGYLVSGGTFQWMDNSAIGSYMERTTYNWIAIGK